MWDEQERFAKVVSRIFIGFLVVLGVVLSAISIVTGSSDCLVAFLLLLLLLVATSLVYGLVALSVGGMLFGITSGVTHCFRWLANHCFEHHSDR
jgi:hypothetical protein